MIAADLSNYFGKIPTQARRVRVSHIDPTLGAGTNGLAFLLQFLETGAAAITWAVAVKAMSCSGPFATAAKTPSLHP